MKMQVWLMAMVVFAESVAAFGDEVKVLYDQSRNAVQVGVWSDQLNCIPGHSGVFATPSKLTVAAHWLNVVGSGFLGLDLKGNLVYADSRSGDHCRELLNRFSGKEFVIGTARRVVTERFGIRFGDVCWQSLGESIKLEIEGLTFEQRNHFTVGPVARDRCPV